MPASVTHDGVEPDIMPIAKGLGGGHAPLGAFAFAGFLALLAGSRSGRMAV